MCTSYLFYMFKYILELLVISSKIFFNSLAVMQQSMSDCVVVVLLNKRYRELAQTFSHS